MKKIQLFDQDVTYIVWKSNPTEDLAFERPRGNICRRRSVNKQFSFVSFRIYLVIQKLLIIENLISLLRFLYYLYENEKNLYFN